MAYEDAYSDEFNEEREESYSDEIINISASYRIGTATYFLMLVLALFFDIFQVLITILSLGTIGAVVSPIMSGLAWILFYIWFKIKDVDLMNTRRFVRSVFAGLVELVPFVDLLPMWTIIVIITARETRREDRQRRVEIEGSFV